MIDRPARDAAALALRRFAADRTTNDEFADALPVRSADPAIRAVHDRAWLLYDDLRVHRLDPSPALRRELARWVVFLHSDVEYRWPPFGFIRVAAPRWLNWLLRGRPDRAQEASYAQWAAAGDEAVWPFWSAAELAAATARPRYLAGRPARATAA